MPSVSRYRTWLAVPADEIEDLKKAHPPMLPGKRRSTM